MHPVGWVHTSGWLSVHHSHREEKHIYCYWHVERNLHMFCLWVDSQLEIITWGGVMMLLSLIYHHLWKIKQSYKQAAFVLLNTHFVMILKKFLHCRSLNRLSWQPFLTSEVAIGEIRFVLLWALSVSSCYSWLSARWAGVSSLSVCILGGCADCVVFPPFLYLWRWSPCGTRIWAMVVGLDAYTVSLQSVQQSFFSYYVAIKPHFIFTHTHTHTPPIYFCSDFVYQIVINWCQELSISCTGIYFTNY